METFFHGFNNIKNMKILRKFIKIIHIKQSLYYSKDSNMGIFTIIESVAFLLQNKDMKSPEQEKEEKIGD